MEESLYKTEADWFNFSEEDLEFLRDLAKMGKYPKTGVKLVEESIRLIKLGNVSEAMKLLDLESEEVKKWKAAEDERRFAMWKSNKNAINFDDSNFSELSEDDLEFIRAEEESHEGVTREEFKEIEDFLFGEMDCEDIDFSEVEKLENSTLSEWLEWKEKEKQRIESLENAVERKLEK